MKTKFLSVFIVGFLVFSFYLSRYSFPIFHSTIEFVIIIISCVIFILAVISRKFEQDSLLINLAPGVFVAAVLTFIHALAYKGVFLFVGYDSNLPTQLWIIINYILAVSLLVTISIGQRKISFYLMLGVYSLFAIFLTTLAFLGIFPDSFVDTGLTQFKIISEYAIIIILMLCILVLTITREKFGTKNYRSMLIFLSLLIVSEFSFTMFYDLYGTYNMIGHLVRFLAFIVLYQSIVVHGIQMPFLDIVRQKNELDVISVTDLLTGLHNRNALLPQFNELSNLYDELAIVYLEVEGVKTLNDIIGHTYGDSVIVEISKAFNKLISESCSIFRFEGHSFIFITKSDNVSRLKELTNEIFSKPILISDHYESLSFNAGISYYPKDGQSYEDLVRKSDLAMFHSRTKPINQFTDFISDYEEAVINVSNIIGLLKSAISNDGFEMVYQPQINIRTNEVVGLEALLRLKNENISPAIFIPLAEKYGLIGTIGEIVIDLVCLQISKWKSEYDYSFPVFINISTHQLLDSNLVGYIQGALDRYNIEYESLGIEITETAIQESKEVTTTTLNQIRKLGIKTAIDDFGSGHAGMHYLVNFKVDIVKLDKSFSDQYLNEETKNIYFNIVDFCAMLGYQIIAEGIEQKSQIDLLESSACDLVQGYYYYKPLKVDDVSLLLKKFSKK